MQYFYDKEQVRYELYRTNGGKGYNWLFFPGGPGIDASYMHQIADLVAFPGNVWMIDLPGNGTNKVEGGYDSWFSNYLRIVKQFENPITVGHSFGAMLSLTFPELESLLSANVILNSIPLFRPQKSMEYAKQFALPDFTNEMQQFLQTQSQETFHAFFKACMPYYFSKENLEEGMRALLTIPFPYEVALWGQQQIANGLLDAKWIPENVPTLIVGGTNDCMCPFELFNEDPRFHKSTITLTCLDGAGHFPWIDSQHAFRQALTKFIGALPS